MAQVIDLVKDSTLSKLVDAIDSTSGAIVDAINKSNTSTTTGLNARVSDGVLIFESNSTSTVDVTIQGNTLMIN